jgi:hypothetical protein
MTTIAYDASRDALYNPQLRPTLFTAAGSYRLEALCAEFARLAYVRFENGGADRTRIEQDLAIVGFEDFAPFNDPGSGTQAFGARRPRDGLAVLAFRGTEPDALTDLATDLAFSLTDWPESGGQVHKGFAAAARGVMPAVDAWVKAGRATRKQLVLTGHSLGAAIATLLASVHKPAALITLGSPRVGDATFAATLAGVDVTRYVDCCDAVTELPPELGHYVHVAPRTYISRAGVVSAGANDDAVQADRESARIAYLRDFAWRTGNVMLRDLADHAPVNYIRSLC